VQEPQALETERQGSRWLYAQPNEEQGREWFGSQRLHAGMDHDPYIGGVVVIGANEKIKQTFQNAVGAWLNREVERMVFTPYVKVDTRIAYFHDWVAHLNADDPFKYITVIEPVPVKIIDNDRSPYFNAHLPEGYFMHVVRNNTNNESFNRYICARWRTAIYERESWLHKVRGDDEARPLLQGIGTKQTLLVKQYADDNALMKAETGAIGRALGVAGILVVGTGIATAEDIQEAMAAPGGAQTAGNEGGDLPDVVAPSEPGPGAPMEGPQVAEGQVQMPGIVDQLAPPETPLSPQETDERLRVRARQLGAELQEASSTAYAAYTQWYMKERHFPPLDQLSGPALNGAVVKLERTLDEARQTEQVEGS